MVNRSVRSKISLLSWSVLIHVFISFVNSAIWTFNCRWRLAKYTPYRKPVVSPFPLTTNAQTLHGKQNTMQSLNVRIVAERLTNSHLQSKRAFQGSQRASFLKWQGLDLNSPIKQDVPPTSQYPLFKDGLRGLRITEYPYWSYLRQLQTVNLLKLCFKQNKSNLRFNYWFIVFSKWYSVCVIFSTVSIIVNQKIKLE